jgi:NADPH:quinone reductase-like Zn-dependent oxidoreductase
MKAVFIEQPGELDSLTYGEQPDPEAGPGEVVLRVRGSALNHADLSIIAGRTNTRGLPRILGLDIAGEVAQVSPTVSGVGEGDRVLVDNRTKCGACEYCVLGTDEYCVNQMRLGSDLDGGHAQFCKVPAVNVHRIPDWMGFEEAASLPIAAHTAWHCLVVRGQLQAWEDILIHAAGSGVGSTGLMIAKHIGARAIVTAGSDWKLEKARELGADEGINYNTTPNFSQRVRELTDGKGVDMVFDVVGAAVWDESLQSLKPGGRLVITGTTSGNQYAMNLSTLQGRPLTLMGSGGRSRRSFADMMKVINNGGIRGVVGGTYSLEEAVEAHRTMEDRNFFGKLVLVAP